jgi:hypothetical protein
MGKRIGVAISVCISPFKCVLECVFYYYYCHYYYLVLGIEVCVLTEYHIKELIPTFPPALGVSSQL